MKNREIKFRAKRIDNGDWRYGYIVKIPLTTENFNTTDGKNFFDSGGISRDILATSTGVCYEIDSKTINEFTGLLDKNGKEIYEGDIVHDGTGKYKIIFEKGVFYGISNDGDDWGLYTTRLYINDQNPILEIIGNIYENPELLAPPLK